MPDNIWDDPPEWTDDDDPCADCPRRDECNGYPEDLDPNDLPLGPPENPPLPS